MARPVWKGFISFGLVHIPVSLFSAENRSELHFHMVDSRNNARVRYERINEVTGEEVPWNVVIKGYEYDDDNLVLLKEEDFKHADVHATQSIDIESFVDRDTVDYIYFDKPYVLAPNKNAEKGYVLLRETLERTNKIGIARVVIRSREYVAALIPRGDALMLNLLRYHGEIKKLSTFDLPSGKSHISAKEIEMATTFVNSLAAKWEPEKYHDKYRDNLLKWIEQKAKTKGKMVIPAEKEEKPTNTETADIIELLRKSMKPRANGNGHGHGRKAA